ncbi:MAG: GNAT family N-acetyltransferase [Eubacteriales bacterium]|jgi:ribosomal-protein-alanine N-acetyltransferase|nr:GNAT family N-acetyltransferase [Clostridiales bacterium]HOQ13784.1 GNAT family N-acetyltransferase [Bacillota bacterium]
MPYHIDLTGTIIKTPRLTLRPIKDDDAEDVYAYASVPGVGEAAGWRHHGSIEETKNIIAMFLAEKNVFAIVDNETGHVIGTLGLHQSWAEEEGQFKGLDIAEVGYVLSKDYWGRGLMTEAVTHVIEYCFETLGLDLLTVGHFIENNRSRRVIEKCGFKFFKNDKYVAVQLDKTFDDAKYTLTRDDWMKRKQH